MKKRMVFATVFVVILVVLTGGVEAPYWIAGTVNDAADGTPANGHTVIIYYWGDEAHYASDTIGSTGTSSTNNAYMCNAESIPGHAFVLGDKIYARVIDTGDGYTAGPVSVVTTGAGFDQEPNMTLQAPAKVVINEFVSDNATEWVELYNNGSSSVDLTGWTLEDEAGHTKSLSALGTIAVGGYKVYTSPSGWLNNGGDVIWLNDSSGEIIDRVGYGISGDAPAPDAGNSTGRYPNGVDTDNDATDFIAFGIPTPDAANEIPLPKDTTAPVTTYEISPVPTAEGWNNVTPVNATFYRVDPDPNPSGVNYTNYSMTSDAGPWTKLDGEVPFNVTINAEGETTIWYYSVDKNETPNVEVANNMTVKIDITAPGAVTGLIETAADYNWIQWNWTNPSDPGSSGFDHVEVWLDEVFKMDITDEEYKAEGLEPNTTYELSIRAVDLAGNIGDWQNDTAKTLEDSTDPIVNVTVPNGGETWTAGTEKDITWTADDNVGVIAVDIFYSVNGGESYTEIITGEDDDGTYSWTVPENSSTTCKVKVVAHDAAGNTGEDASDANFTIISSDEEEPTYTWIDRPTSGTTGETAFVNLSAIDKAAVTVYTITINGNENAMTKNGDYYIYTINVPSGSTAEIVYNCTFGDDAGNTNTTPDTMITVTDNDEPRYEWLERPDAGTTGESVGVNVSATDNIGVTVYSITVDGDEHVMTKNGDYYTYTIDILSGSTAEIVYNCTFGDEAGRTNTTADTVITVTDNDEPAYEWVSRPEGGTTGEGVLVNVSATDNIGVTVYTITVDGVENAMTKNGDYYTYLVGIPSTSTAEIVYNCTFGDEAGRTNTTADTVITVTDNDEPIIVTVMLDKYEVAPSEPINVTVNASDTMGVVTITADGIPLSLVAGTPQQGQWYGTITAPSDAWIYTVRVEAKDAANNSAINDTVQYTTWKSAKFDTGAAGTYPSISGIHKGIIIPSHTIVVKKMYTYPCAGTGGHTEYVAFYNVTTGIEIANATWTGYREGDYHTITFPGIFTLVAGHEYRYEIRTESYPQIIHEQNYTTLDGSFINCTSFEDVNGGIYSDWIPAIRLFP